MVSEKMDADLFKFKFADQQQRRDAFKQIIKLIERFYRLGYNHNDLHRGNILVKYDSRKRKLIYRLTGFKFSMKKPLGPPEGFVGHDDDSNIANLRQYLLPTEEVSRFQFSSDVYQPFMTPSEQREPDRQPSSSIQILPFGEMYRPEQFEDVLPPVEDQARAA